MMTKVKICGIRSIEAGVAAAENGAWAVGFVFAPSCRRISSADAAAIVRQLPGDVKKVGVFVNAPRDEVVQTAQACGLDMLQFHGEESPEYCRRWDLPVIKAFAVGDNFTAAALKEYDVTAYLLDSSVQGMRGGTGIAFDWDIAAGIANEIPLIVAGGLTPDNIGTVIKKTCPFALDVSSGVETDGEKDLHKIVSLFREIRRVDYEYAG